MRRRPRHPSALVALAATALCLVLGACSAGAEETPQADETSAPSSSETVSGETADNAEPAHWPLTGLEMKKAAPKHPVMVTKVDNTSSSAPQVGLGSADMIVEELVEGGYTRLAAFFYSQIPDTVGPVRSMRASDIGIVPTHAQVVTSGAAAVTIARINGAGIPFFGEGSPGVYRETSRYAPYNLFARLKETTAAATKRAGKKSEPADYLPWGTEADLPKGRKVTRLTADFGAHSTSWTYGGKGVYTVDNSYMAQGDQFPATNVLVMRVRVGDAGYRDPAGYPVPETILEGKGPATLFHGGRAIEGTWSKDGLRGQISLTDKEGNRLTVPAGKTWIELVPQGQGGLTTSK